MSAPVALDSIVLDVMCALCFVKYASAAVQRGARAGAVTDEVFGGSPGKLVATEPRSIRPQRKARERGSVEAPKADAEEAASETATR